MTLLLDHPNSTAPWDDDLHVPTSTRTDAWTSHDTSREARPRWTLRLRSEDGNQLQINVYDDHLPTWFRPMIDVVERLLQLEPGWNSHNAAPVPALAVVSALSVANATMQDQTPLPQITPLSSGGLQLTWHTAAAEVEIAIDRRGQVSVWYENVEQGIQDEFSESLPFSRLRQIVAHIIAQD